MTTAKISTTITTKLSVSQSINPETRSTILQKAYAVAIPKLLLESNIGIEEFQFSKAFEDCWIKVKLQGQKKMNVNMKVHITFNKMEKSAFLKYLFKNCFVENFVKSHPDSLTKGSSNHQFLVQNCYKLILKSPIHNGDDHQKVYTPKIEKRKLINVLEKKVQDFSVLSNASPLDDDFISSGLQKFQAIYTGSKGSTKNQVQSLIRCFQSMFSKKNLKGDEHDVRLELFKRATLIPISEILLNFSNSKDEQQKPPIITVSKAHRCIGYAANIEDSFVRTDLTLGYKNDPRVIIKLVKSGSMGKFKRAIESQESNKYVDKAIKQLFCQCVCLELTCGIITDGINSLFIKFNEYQDESVKLGIEYKFFNGKDMDSKFTIQMMILSIMMKDLNPYNLGYWMESMVKPKQQITKEENATLLPTIPFDQLPDCPTKRFLAWKKKKELDNY